MCHCCRQNVDVLYGDPGALLCYNCRHVALSMGWADFSNWKKHMKEIQTVYQLARLVGLKIEGVDVIIKIGVIEARHIEAGTIKVGDLGEDKYGLEVELGLD